MAMVYDLSAIKILKTLGYGEVVGKEWLDKLKHDKKIELPQTYCDFMELVVDSPLLSTSNLWTGKMAHGVCIPMMYYEELEESIQDRTDRWSKRPAKWERSLHELSQLPMTEWTEKVEDHLIIGSDYEGGMGVFGIRKQDLSENDPPVYWHKDSGTVSISEWKLEQEKLSDFLLNVLVEALNCVEYQSAEDALEVKGWSYEEYFDIKKDDWVASKSVLKKYGIDFSKLKKHKASSCKVFCCYDEERNAFFVGNTQDGEISLSAINRAEAENIFLDFHCLEFWLEEARLYAQGEDEGKESQPMYYYVKTKNLPLRLSDYCRPDYAPQKGENGEELCPQTSDGEPLYLLCRTSTLEDIVCDVLKKKPKASNQELIEALNDCLNQEFSKDDTK